MKKTIITLLFFTLFLNSCGKEKLSVEENTSARFEKGLAYFEKGKFSKAQIEFEYIVMNNPGSSDATESEFYLAEALFEQKKYPEASIEYDRFARYSHDLDKIAQARFRICECTIHSTYNFQKDQSGTKKALNRLQDFIEDFPGKEPYITQANQYITEMRNKLARKQYETGRLYLKLEEFEAALIYFNDVLDNYYDTDYADEARIDITFSYVLEGDRDEARDFLESNQNNFHSAEKYKTGLQILSNTEDEKLTLKEYIRLYK